MLVLEAHIETLKAENALLRRWLADAEAHRRKKPRGRKKLPPSFRAPCLPVVAHLTGRKQIVYAGGE